MAYGVSKKLEQQLFWFVMGYYIEHIGNALLIYKLHKQKTIYGVSIESQICLLIATISRAVWFNDTRLPTMRIAWIELTLAILMHAYIVYLCYRYKDNLYKEPPKFVKSYVLVAIAFILSLIFHPGDKHKTYFFTQQMFVSFTMFTEALSLVSQLWHMKTSMAVEGINTWYLLAVGISRLSRIYFWYSMSSKLKQFWYLIAADALHTFLTIGFAYQYKLI